MIEPIKAPFPWFGGKMRAASLVWSALGDPVNFIEPFAGSCAVYLSRPHPHHIATLNDACGYIANFWRALRAEPERIAELVDRQVNENDLHAVHHWLVERKSDLVARLEGDKDYFDVEIAALWCWGLCAWIGGGWCSGKGPWRSVDGKLVKMESGTIPRQIPSLINGGIGVHRIALGVKRQLPDLGNGGRGVHRNLPHLGNAGRGVNRSADIMEWMLALAERLRPARVTCGDWQRVTGPSVTVNHGLTGMFLDPPYSFSERDSGLYSTETDCSTEVREWCAKNGDDPKLRIVLAGYDGEHNALEEIGWSVVAWKAHGGYGNRSDKRGRENAHRERLWMSPHCLVEREPEIEAEIAEQSALFA